MRRSLFLALALSASSAAAYPISPGTLWDLTAAAELVVVARVEALHDDVYAPASFAHAAQWKADPKSRGSEELARLRVVETLKGTPAEVLEVRTGRGMVCPAPGQFLVGETVLVFLSSYAGNWHVEGLSYGTLYPPTEDLPVMKERLTQAVALQAAHFTTAQRLDWAVGTAARRATRWHGAYELASALDPDHAYYDEKRRGPPMTLTQGQQRVLAAGFVSEPSADGTTVMIATLLRGHVDPLLDRAFVGAVDALLEANDVSTAYQAMSAVIARAGADPALLLKPVDPESPTLEALREAWRGARSKLHLPRGARLPPGPPACEASES